MCSRLVFLVLAVGWRLGRTLELELGAGSETYWDQHSQALLPLKPQLTQPQPSSLPTVLACLGLDGPFGECSPLQEDRLSLIWI